MSRASRVRYWLLVGILLVAAALRFGALTDAPPGVAHDEVAEVLIAESILDGRHALFFREAYGQEPLFLYLVAGALVAFGRNVLALHFIAASVGLLTVAAGARLARRLFGPWEAIIAAAGLAGMLWPVFWSRVGLRGMTLPLLMCLGADAMWRALRGCHHSRRHALLAGLWWGLAAYTYSASRGLPLLLGGYLAYAALAARLWLRGRWRVRSRWREWMILLGVAALVATPLVLYLHQNPALQFRVAEVNAPLTALRQGDPGPVLENVPRILGMFSVRGDATERNNFPGRPVFPEPVWALAFYIGLGVALWRWRTPQYALVLLWLIVMLTPSLVTIEAPNFVRTLGALPPVMILPGIGVAWCRERLARWTEGNRSGPRVVAAVMAVAFVANVGLTARDYFVRWPQIPEVGFVWQRDFVAVADWLDAHSEIEAVTVAGLSNATMDAPSLDLLLQREDAAIRWVDTGSPLSAGGALVVPAAGGRLIVPDVAPLDATLAAHLADRGASKRQHARFAAFELPPPVPAATMISWENLAFEKLTPITSSWRAGERVTLLSHWRAVSGAHPPTKIFLHLVDAAGQIRAQHDGLDAPARFWRAGDQIVQRHTLVLPAALPPGAYDLRIGLYDPATLAPYPTHDGRDYVTTTVEVLAP